MSVNWWDVAGAVVPSIALAIAFVVVVRAMVNADRREREAERRPGEAGHEHVSRIPTRIQRKRKS
ncbi:MAG TPA: hypothetical protein VK063_09780 [Beutenbergiaceae bacterium]|nr:hypothetical protein [Beutenbergiaceae bacterium]